MAMDAQDIHNMISAGIPDSEVRIEDLRGDGEHYAAYVTSPAFKGKTRIQQHRMVQDALQGSLKKELHALAIQTSLPNDK